jgi:hypothetical protein
MRKRILILLFLGPLSAQARATDFFVEGGGGLTQFSSSDPANYYQGMAGDFANFSDSVDNFHGYFDTGLFLTPDRRWSLDFGVSFGPYLQASGSVPGGFSDSIQAWELYLEPMYRYRFGSSPWELSVGPHVGLTLFRGESAFSSYNGQANWSTSGSAFSYGGLVNLRAYLGPDFFFDLGALYERADITNIDTTQTYAAGLVPDYSPSGVDLSGTTLRIGFGFVFGGQEEEARPRRFRRRREVIVQGAPPQEEAPDAGGPEGDELPPATGSDQASVEARDRRQAHDELQAQKYPDAERDYRKATQEVPGDYVAWLGLGNALYYQGRQADAVAAYQQSLKLHPDAELSKLVERLRKAQP